MNILKSLYDKITSVPTVFTDGILYGFIAMFVFMQGFLSGEESYKYVNPHFLFWLKFSIGSIAAFLGAIKMFRSNSFSEYLKRKENNNGQKPDNDSKS